MLVRACRPAQLLNLRHANFQEFIGTAPLPRIGLGRTELLVAAILVPSRRTASAQPRGHCPTESCSRSRS